MKRAFLVLAIAFALVGCKDNYGACAKAGADIAQGVASGLSTVQQLQAQGEISAAEALNVAGYLEFVNKGDEAFLTCIQTAHMGGNKPGTYTACVTAFNTTLNTPAELALIKINNATASATINTIVTGFTTGLALVETNLKGA